MQGFIDLIRKMVVMVLILELIMQLQPGKNYEPYLKMFVGLFIVYSLVSGIFDGALQEGFYVNWPTYELEWVEEETKEDMKEIEKIEIPINQIKIEKIEIERIGQLP